MLLKTFESRRSGWELRSTVAGWALATFVLVCAIGCGPEAGLSGEPEELGVVTQWEDVKQEVMGISAQNIIMGNGLNLNGLNLNGLNLNGLNLNGLNLNGLSTSAFHNWFQADISTRNEVMKYVVACAVASGQTRTYTDTTTGTVYTWTGALGLAPSWANGSAATTEELQVVSACMAAHANKYGIHVVISILGIDGAGDIIPSTSSELSTYNIREACFFGNLFDGSTGTFGGNDGIFLTSGQSSPRVCGIAGSPNTSQCAPMIYVGNCSTYCTRDKNNTFYTSCTYNGTTYRPITTRMKPQDIYRCGDGVCQGTEKCDTGKTHTSCAADCGTCS